jgi:hypothetical protein
MDEPICVNPIVKINSYFKKLASHAVSVNGFRLSVPAVSNINRADVRQSWGMLSSLPLSCLSQSLW